MRFHIFFLKKRESEPQNPEPGPNFIKNMATIIHYRILFCFIFLQYCGSVDPYHWLTDPESDPALFVRADKMPTKQKFILFKVILLITFWRYIYVSLQR